MRINLIYRTPKKNQKSIEEIFTRLAVLFNEIHDYDVTNIYYSSTKSLFENIYKIRNSRADIYHITGDVAYLSIFLIDKKNILTIHDIGHYKNLNGLKKIIYGMLWILLPILASKKVTVVSDFTKKDILAKFPVISPKKIVVVPNPSPNIKSRRKKIFNKNYPSLLQVGTKKHKNLSRVIESIRDMSCKLLILGKLSHLQKIELSNNKIDYDNFVNLKYSDVIELYYKSDMLIFASTHEGFGMPIIEAQVIGTPVITSNICSMPEVAGEGALLVNPFCINSIKKAIVKLISSSELKRNLIVKGSQNVRRFEDKKIAEKYINCYLG